MLAPAVPDAAPAASAIAFGPVQLQTEVIMKNRPIACVQVLAVAAGVSFLLAGCDKREEAAPVPAPAASAAAPAASTVTPPTGTTVGTEIDASVVTARVKSALLADRDAN